MRLTLPLLAAVLVAGTILPAHAETKPVKGAVQGTATIGKGVAKGAGQVGTGVVKGTGTAVKSTGRGLRCIFTLGNRC
ncbi:MAG: hypothetical protein ACR2J1_11065 [Methyloceanibacter sp.]|uniref:hypothetical protein n=1 Tax=Methyloceanibacter sp. TaxID=1965321 RepID=UPI003D9B19DE